MATIRLARSSWRPFSSAFGSWSFDFPLTIPAFLSSPYHTDRVVWSREDSIYARRFRSGNFALFRPAGQADQGRGGWIRFDRGGFRGYQPSPLPFVRSRAA